MDITNNSGATITIDSVHADWVKTGAIPSQKLDKLLLDNNEIWNISDVTPPSYIPTEGNFVNGADRTILNAITRNFVLRFGDPGPLEFGNYQVSIVFDNTCQVSGSITLP